MSEFDGKEAYLHLQLSASIHVIASQLAWRAIESVSRIASWNLWTLLPFKTAFPGPSGEAPADKLTVPGYIILHTGIITLGWGGEVEVEEGSGVAAPTAGLIETVAPATAV